MNKLELFNVNTGDYMERVSRRTAKRLYNAGEPIILLPCKCFTDYFSFETKENEKEIRTFDSLVNEFEYYNCNYKCGYYAAFYVVSGNIRDSWKGDRND